MKNLYILSLAVLSLVVISCSKDELDISDGTKSRAQIGIEGIEAKPAITKSNAVTLTSTSSFNDEAAGFFLDVEKTVEPIDNEKLTKAGEYTVSTLLDKGFVIDGYLDSKIKAKEGASNEDKMNQHFIDNQNAVSNGATPAKWKFESDEYQWRYGTDHHFWAYTHNLPGGLSFCQKDAGNGMMVPDTTKTTFNYTSYGSEDVLVAYTKQYFGKDEETNLHDQVLHLTFNHALTEVQVNLSDVIFKQRNPVTNVDTDPADGRCSIKNIYFRKVKDSGTCTVDKGVCSWSDLEGGTSTNALQINANSPSFLIPQDSDSLILHVEVEDALRQLTRPFIFEADKVFDTGNWKPGYKYGYNFKGKFIVPELPAGQSGIDTDFAGKPFQTLAVINGVAGKYIKKLTLNWNGLPTTNGNGTYVFVSYEPEGSTPSESSYMDGSNNPNTSKSNIGFVYDCKNRTRLKGTIVSTDSCSCTFELPDTLTGIINIYVAYIGGSNGSDACGWRMRNMTMTIDEWR